MLLDTDFSIEFLNPYSFSKSYLINTVLSVMCEPLKSHIGQTWESHIKIVHDAQMGGSIYAIGSPLRTEPDKHIRALPGFPLYSFLQRSFVCLNKDHEPVLFMDNIEGGHPYFNNLNHWRGFYEHNKEQCPPNRMYKVFFALGAAIYIAGQLGIKQIVPRDFELVELTKLLGIGEKSVFSKDQGHWKIGLHSEKIKTGVYVHSLYRGGAKNRMGHQIRHPVLERPPYDTPQDFLDQQRDLSHIIKGSNEGRKSKRAPKTNERMNTLEALSKIVQGHPMSSTYLRNAAKSEYESMLSYREPIKVG